MIVNASMSQPFKEAMFYTPIENKGVVCNLCRHRCKILEGRLGTCGVRYNKGGKLLTLVYEKIIAAHVDPIEKKPLFHVWPGSSSFSVATVGCNFHCDFCQNADISQVKIKASPESEPSPEQIPGEQLSVEQVVEIAEQHHCKSIAYTYTEPTIFYEYAYEAGKLAHRHSILNVFVTNGYLTAEALKEIKPYLDAANVDLKGFNADFYRKKIGAKLEEVLDSLKLMKSLGIWIEVTTLIVPGWNDKEDDLRKVAHFIYAELGEDTPWHISRFFPHYKMMDVEPTPVHIIRKAREIGLETGLRYVYTGNLPGDEGEHTYCYHCNKILIRRYGYTILENHIKEGKCEFCGAVIDGIGLN